MIIAALLLLAISFAGEWILNYVHPEVNPWRILPWFGIAAAVIVILGIASNVFLGRRRNDK